MCHPMLQAALSQLFQMVYYQGIKRPESTWPKVILEDLGTLLCPPVQLDWEVIYRLGKQRNISLQECWRRSKYLLIAYNLLTFLEHVVLMAPIAGLNIALERRNSLLSPDYPPIPEEIFSNQMTKYLIGIGFSVFAILPCISLQLSHLYFTKWHAWSRILKGDKS